MLSVQQTSRKPSSRYPFRAPLWDDHHDDFSKIDAALPADHPARWLRQVVSRLDLNTFRQSYKGYGSLAYPVESLLAFVLFMYSEGILSPAAWFERARYDDQSKWLLRGLVPSRSQLYTFRDRTEPFLDDWHKQLLAWAILEGITTASRGGLDGTFVAALASRHQLIGGRRVDRRLLLLRLLVWLDDQPQGRLEDLPLLVAATLLFWLLLLEMGLEAAALGQTLLNLLVVLELLSPQQTTPAPQEMLLWQAQVPAWVPRSVAGRRRVLRRHEDARQRLALKLQPYQRKKKLSKKDEQAIKRMKVSLTDREAALGWDKLGTFRPLYNLVVVQATDAPLTLAWDVLSRNNDDGLLKPMVEKTRQQVGDRFREVLVDGAFVSVGEVAWCEKQGITVYAPPSKAEAALAEMIKEDGKRGEGARAAKDEKTAKPAQANKPGKLPKEAFRYDDAEKVYYCPEGKRLEAKARTTLKRHNGIELPMIVHQASGQDCQECPRQQDCTSNPKKGRVVKRYEGEEALQRLEKRMAEPANQAIYKQRCQSVERGYADFKEHRDMGEVRGFGRKRARAQAGLVILACNGLNLMRALKRRHSAAPPPVPQENQAA